MGTERLPHVMPSVTPTSATPDPVAAEVAALRALRVQMLATEHWSLLATRSLSWNESFARAGMFLTLLSGAVVSLALVAQATSFGDGFMLFAELLLPVVLFVGVATFVRLVEINNEDYVWVLGMNRLRHAYLEIDPALKEHFVTGWDEDATSILRTYGTHEGGGFFHALVTTPTTIAFVDAMVAAILASVLLVRTNMPMVPVAGVGVAVFVITIAVLGVYGIRMATMAAVANAATRARTREKTESAPR
jgi:hypothetical protein